MPVTVVVADDAPDYRLIVRALLKPVPDTLTLVGEAADRKAAPTGHGLQQWHGCLREQVRVGRQSVASDPRRGPAKALRDQIAPDDLRDLYGRGEPPAGPVGPSVPLPAWASAAALSDAESMAGAGGAPKRLEFPL